MEPCLHTLRISEGQDSAVEELKKYLQKFREHLPAHRLAYKFLSDIDDFEEMQNEELKVILMFYVYLIDVIITFLAPFTIWQ